MLDFTLFSYFHLPHGKIRQAGIYNRSMPIHVSHGCCGAECGTVQVSRLESQYTGFFVIVVTYLLKQGSTKQVLNEYNTADIRSMLNSAYNIILTNVAAELTRRFPHPTLTYHVAPLWSPFPLPVLVVHRPPPTLHAHRHVTIGQYSDSSNPWKPAPRQTYRRISGCVFATVFIKLPQRWSRRRVGRRLV